MEEVYSQPNKKETKHGRRRREEKAHGSPRLEVSTRHEGQGGDGIKRTVRHWKPSRGGHGVRKPTEGDLHVSLADAQISQKKG